MSDALSFAELDEQRVELLPARTLLSAGAENVLPEFEGVFSGLNVIDFDEIIITETER